MTKRKETPQEPTTVSETVKSTPKSKKRTSRPRSKAQQEQIAKIGKATRFKSGQEAAEAGRKGGRKSGQSKRDKRTMAEWAKYFLDLPLNEGEVTDDEESFEGFAGKNTSVRGRIMKNLMTKASNGDLHAIALISDLTGETSPKQLQVEVTVKDPHEMTDEEIDAFIEKHAKLLEQEKSE
ncbi:MAG: hypothetical protein IKN41_05010 [Candidatus Methanomethylophilaceae archaeon]|nr:hypothetical protein [Candidatus Methanomethylophilaceae archaeon]